MNWKAQALNAVKEQPLPARGPDPGPDFELGRKLAEALRDGKIAPRDRDFAQSLLAGQRRYGGFTDRQRPHVERLLKSAETPAPALPAPDAPLAEALKAALPHLSARDRDFAESLLAGFAKWGGFTDRQRPYAERLAGHAPDVPRGEFVSVERIGQNPTDGKPVQPVSGSEGPFGAEILPSLPRGVHAGASPEALGHAARSPQEGERAGIREHLPAARETDSEALSGVQRAEGTEAPPGLHAPLGGRVVVPGVPSGNSRRVETFPAVVALFGPGKFARFDGDGIRLRARQDFSLIWLKNSNDTVLGRLLPDGTFIPKYHNDSSTDRAVEQLRALNADPIGYAKANGLLTGRCCCCGRALTDPLSIEKGIGPVCEARF